MAATLPGDDGAEVAHVLLDVVRATCRDLHRQSTRRVDVRLDSSLDRDLGLDSLTRVELLLRVERTFGVRLPESTLELVETPRDLLTALRAGTRISGVSPSVAARATPREALQGEPDEATTLLEVLDWHVQRHPSRTQIIISSEEGEEEISYGKLMLEAAAIAARLRESGLEARQAVAIMLPTGPSYFYAYFGILLAGGIPVPIYPPARLSQIEDHVRRHAGILANAEAVMLITVPEAMPVARLLEAVVPGLREVIATTDLPKERGTFARAAVKSDDIAFIQYTSGSTGNPKGVVLTHANLLANIRAIRQAVAITADDVFVSWLPLYHDMGLISAWLASLYLGNPLVVMSPLAFLARPESWLWAIHRHRGTLTAAPNFAFELCLKRIDDRELEGLDLSSLRLVANGAEPVSPETMDRFIARFAKFGLRRAAMAPVYGLAEATVALLVPPLGRGPLVDCIRRQSFVRDRKALPAAPDDPKPLRFVACGRPLPGHRIRVVDAAGAEVGEREEGRLEFQGPSATAGYYRNPDETRKLLHGEWLDTGDRAYVADGDVYLTGRVKDIIIRGGRNIYPHEIEEAVGALPGIRKGCVAAFGSADPAAGTERLVVLAETRAADAMQRDHLRGAIVRTVSDVLGEPPDEVVLAPPHTVLKTSSGKIRRAASREVYEAGRVGARAHAVWWQIARLGWTGAVAQLRAGFALGGRALYGAHVWAVFGLLAPLVWLVTAATPKPAWAWLINRAAARLFLRVAGIPLRVLGVDNLPRDKPHVLVANHASYLDGMVLVAALPAPYRFVAKRELLQSLVPRVYLRRLGADFVERFSPKQSVADADRLAAVARVGPPLAVFPEGTFRRSPGLLAFHLGAFAAAVQARVPVVPVAIRGSRLALAAEEWLPRRHAIVVTIGAPIAIPGEAPDDFAAAVTLRNLAREAILPHVGEGDADVALRPPSSGLPIPRRIAPRCAGDADPMRHGREVTSD